MNKELEIQELAKEFCGRLDLNGHLQCKGCEAGRNECSFTDYANIVYDAGYRKIDEKQVCMKIEKGIALDIIDLIESKDAWNNYGDIIETIKERYGIV